VATGSRPIGVLRVYFQEISAGDRRKIEGKSNDAKTGGGARDLRFNYKQMHPFFVRMFPQTRAAKRDSEVLRIHHGTVSWIDNEGRNKVSPIEFWPPTVARPSEGRLGRINQLGNLRDLPPNSEGRLFVTLTQLETGEIRVRHVSEKVLLNARITNQTVVAQVSMAIAAQRGNTSIRGYLDWEKGDFLPDA
jgi:hypothetical protein